MIEDIYFEKFEFPMGSNISMKILPPLLSPLRSSEGVGTIAQRGLIPRFEFSITNQPLTPSQLSSLRQFQKDAKNRPVLFQNPFHNRVEATPTVTSFGSYYGGAFIRPLGAYFFQPIIYYGDSVSDRLTFRPVAWAENLKYKQGNSLLSFTYDFVTKSSSLGQEALDATSTEVRFAEFDYWLACRITQFEAFPIANDRSLTITDNCEAFLCSITLEEDVTASLPVHYSWDSVESLVNQ